MSQIFHASPHAPSTKNAARTLQWIAALAVAMMVSSTVHAQWFAGNAFGGITGGNEADGTPLLVCRSKDPNFPGQHPGKKHAEWNFCSFAYGGSERFTANYESLTPAWTTDATRAIGFGIDANGNVPLAVCRAGVDGGGLQLGKRLAPVESCAVPFGNQELWVSTHSMMSRDGFGMETPLGFAPLALIGGYEQNATLLYPCLAIFAGGTHPGKITRGGSACVISYGGGVQSVTTFATLVPRFRSVTETSARIYVGGVDSNGTQLGVCRTTQLGGMQVGKYRFASGACHISFGGQEKVFFSNFETLRLTNN